MVFEIRAETGQKEGSVPRIAGQLGITVYLHIIPGMQADAATVFSNLVAGILPPTVPTSEVVDDE